MGGNVDLQYIINEIATVKYVYSYMTKGEKGMGHQISNVGVVNVADEEKHENCTGDDKYER